MISKNKTTIDIDMKHRSTEKRIWKIANNYVAIAEDYPDVNPDIIEGAKNMIAEDILMFEKQEEYEVCGRLKKAFEYLEQFK
jgi:hypothetical protein|tara:strand:+ start:251 stop:496 length:246 start_codon:yes stop_codon:yes gene_type:complete